jgi:competence protein ComEA
MAWKKLASDYLTFTRKDRIGILLIIFLILIIVFLPDLISKQTTTKPPTTDTAWIAAMKKLEQDEPVKPFQSRPYNREGKFYSYNRPKDNNNERPKVALFFFDPNTITADGWKKLGLRDKTIATIQNYLGKGGHFKKPEDLQRIYGLHPDEYERLSPFVTIATGKQPDPDKNAGSNYTNETLPSKNFASRYSPVEINTADTSAFIALPGIGSKLAARIVNFRDKLGGFYAIRQVAETFGLPDSTFQRIREYLKLENTTVRKININTATADELKAHPYIRWNLANPIIAYRNEHGAFLKMEDLKKVMGITDDIYNKITPYLIVP